MHESAFLKISAFRDVYLREGLKRVLDVGSMSNEPPAGRTIFSDARFEYIGLDHQAGPNVDLVPAEPYHWAELESNSFDAVISSSCFEHDPFYWITLAEIARVLQPGGFLCVTAPSTGPVHRFPQDCWRFYPDAAAAMFAWVGLEVVESYVEAPRHNKVISTKWRDMFAVGRKLEESNLERLNQIVSLAPHGFKEGDSTRLGACIDAYESAVTVSARKVRELRVRRIVAKLVWRPIRVSRRLLSLFSR